MTVFLIVYISNFLYVFFKKRKIDLFTIFFLSSSFYSIPLFFGTLYDPYNYKEYNIDILVYFFYSGYYLILLLFIFMYDNTFSNKNKQLYTNIQLINKIKIKEYYNILFILIFTLLVSFFLKDPYFLIVNNSSKANFSQFGLFSALYIWGSLILFSLALFLEDKKRIFIAFLFIFITFFGGSRAYMLATILMFFLYQFIYLKSKLKLMFQYKYIVLGALLLLLFIVYKLVYNYIRLLNFNMMFNILSSFDKYMFRILQGGENFQTMVSLQHSLLDLAHYNLEYTRLFTIKLIPFFSKNIAYAFSVNIENFNDILKNNFYYNVNYGVSSSFWGEMIYSFGITGCFIVLLLFLFLIGIFNYKIQKNIKLFHIFMYPGVVYIVFYIHRNDFNFMIYAVYITIAFYFLITFIRQILLRKTKTTNRCII